MYNKLVWVCERCNKELYQEEMLTNDENLQFVDDNYENRSVAYVSLCCYAPVVEEWREHDE